MSGFNRVVLCGNLSRDAKLVGEKGNVLVFTVASQTCIGSKSKGTYKEFKNFFDVVSFGERAAAIAEYMTEGRQVTVDGRLSARKREKEGVEYWTNEVVAENIVFGDGDNKAEAAADPFA